MIRVSCSSVPTESIAKSPPVSFARIVGVMWVCRHCCEIPGGRCSRILSVSGPRPIRAMTRSGSPTAISCLVWKTAGPAVNRARRESISPKMSVTVQSSGPTTDSDASGTRYECSSSTNNVGCARVAGRDGRPRPIKSSNAAAMSGTIPAYVSGTRRRIGAPSYSRQRPTLPQSRLGVNSNGGVSTGLRSHLTTGRVFAGFDPQELPDFRRVMTSRVCGQSTLGPPSAATRRSGRGP
jgi:hypothetical protein